MNFERFELSDLDLDFHQVKDSLRCLLHSILFTRQIIQPTAYEEVKRVAEFNLQYVKCTDHKLNEIVENALDKLMDNCERSTWNRQPIEQQQPRSSLYTTPTRPSYTHSHTNTTSSAIISNHKIILCFYDSHVRKLWWGERADKKIWEKWVLRLRIHFNKQTAVQTRIDSPKVMSAVDRVTRDQVNEKRQQLIQANLFKILTAVQSKNNHLSPLSLAFQQQLSSTSTPSNLSTGRSHTSTPTHSVHLNNQHRSSTPNINIATPLSAPHSSSAAASPSSSAVYSFPFFILVKSGLSEEQMSSDYQLNEEESSNQDEVIDQSFEDDSVWSLSSIKRMIKQAPPLLNSLAQQHT